MMLDQLNIDSCLPGRDRRELEASADNQYYNTQMERERNRRAMEKRKAERPALPAPTLDADAIRAEAEAVIIEALDGRDLDGAAREFIALVGQLARATEAARTDKP
jgi:hypothetical protein